VSPTLPEGFYAEVSRSTSDPTARKSFYWIRKMGEPVGAWRESDRADQSTKSGEI
jgi:hypothetical protein